MELSISPKDIKEEMMHQLRAPNKAKLGPNFTPHKRVLDKLLEEIEEIDFQSEAKTDKKLQKKHYVVITVEKILELAKDHNWGLSKRNGFIYLYNGAFWSPVEDDDLQIFLGKAAQSMGVNKFESKYHRFRDELVKQFMSTAHIPAPEYHDSVVLINLQNGTVEINPEIEEAVLLRNPESEDFLTYQLPFAFNPHARAPLFEKYLNEVLPSKDLQRLMAEYIGYVFVRTSTLKLEKALLLYGSGANGKSVFFEIVNALLGETNVSNFTIKSLTDSNGYHRAKIANRLVNYASEIDGQLETAIFKQLVSGEPVEARLPYKDPFTLTNYAKLIFNCNELPTDVEHTNAFFRRFLIVPFDVTIPEEEQDRQLSQKIIASELSGVFNWVLDGLKRLLNQKGFTQCKEVEEQIESFRRNSDSVLSFISERSYKESFSGYTSLKELYQSYRRFCEDEGYRACGSRTFSSRLTNAGFNSERKEYGKVFYLIQK
ncbi:DNA primase family protein [Gracilimonas sp.]|uniref:DNA primase family protein n=1 Tax=Gracilimonas sp. TaxID=1974203 RepID=UPI003D13970A